MFHTFPLLYNLGTFKYCNLRNHRGRTCQSARKTRSPRSKLWRGSSCSAQRMVPCGQLCCPRPGAQHCEARLRGWRWWTITHLSNTYHTPDTGDTKIVKTWSFPQSSPFRERWTCKQISAEVVEALQWKILNCGVGHAILPRGVTENLTHWVLGLSLSRRWPGKLKSWQRFSKF